MTQGAMHSAKRAFGVIAPTSNCSTTPGRPPTPSSGTTVPMYHRLSSRSNAARPSYPQPKLHRETTCRPHPSHQHPGPPPRPKNQNCLLSETDQPSRQPRRTGDTKLSPKPSKHLLHPMKHLLHPSYHTTLTYVCCYLVKGVFLRMRFRDASLGLTCRSASVCG
jgi:hypothetical protein